MISVFMLLKVFPKEVNATFGFLPQVQKFAKNANLTLAIPEIVYGSHDSKGTLNQYFFKFHKSSLLAMIFLHLLKKTNIL